MAKIPLSSGYQLVPEGLHVFQITEVEYKEDFGKMNVTMETVDGIRHIERFSLMRDDGSVNEGALTAFSFFARAALNDDSLSEIDHEDLVGQYMECVVEHDKVPSSKYPGRFNTYARLKEKYPSNGYPGQKATSTEKLDLDDILG